MSPKSTTKAFRTKITYLPRSSRSLCIRTMFRYGRKMGKWGIFPFYIEKGEIHIKKKFSVYLRQKKKPVESNRRDIKNTELAEIYCLTENSPRKEYSYVLEKIF